MPAVSPIEEESYRILDARVDLSALGPLSRAVVARVIYASADVEYARTLVVDEDSLARGVEALRAGAPVVTDVEMVRAGVTGLDAHCYSRAAVPAEGLTRSAAGIRAAAEQHREGAVFVVGCAPTALVELMALSASGQLQPALVVGLPVGFVRAAEAKQELRESGLPAVSNVGEKGGSAVASAALNALVRLARAGQRS